MIHCLSINGILPSEMHEATLSILGSDFCGLSYRISDLLSVDSSDDQFIHSQKIAGFMPVLHFQRI